MIGNPFPLKQNAGKSFIGSYVLGMGFILTNEQANDLINRDPRNKEVLYPYLNGEDLNNDPEQKPSRWVINFLEWDEAKARSYPDCYGILERLVKPERLKKNDQRGREKWWQFLRVRRELYETISQLDQVMVLTRVSKYVVVEMVSSKQIFMEKIVVKTFQDMHYFGILQSSIYNEWAWKYSSTLGSGTINYSPSACFDTFPFPENTDQSVLLSTSLDFYTLRKEIMQRAQLGLTKLYNQFHNHLLRQIDNEDIDDRVFVKKYGKDSLYLKKHLHAHNLIAYNNVVTKIEQLRCLQIKMDTAVLQAYGWADIQLQYGFYAIEYLPETDRTRFSIHPDARREILKRLLDLNKHYYSNEVECSVNHLRGINERKIEEASAQASLFRGTYP